MTDKCTSCRNEKDSVMKRLIGESVYIALCVKCANKKRRIQNVSGKQLTATEPPIDNGVYRSYRKS